MLLGTKRVCAPTHLAVLACLVGCEVDLRDCMFFADGCEAYRPEGLNCGLAHRGYQHDGGSCDLGYDPALEATSSGIIASRAAQSACPEGFERALVGDHEAPDQWAACKAVDNGERSSGNLRDVPAGSACGLSDLFAGLGARCAGVDLIAAHEPGESPCPPGTTLRWLPDLFHDDLDPVSFLPECDTEVTDDCVEHAFIVPLAGTDVKLYCAVDDDVGCSDCPDYAWQPGLLCGLHSRAAGGDTNTHTWLPYRDLTAYTTEGGFLWDKAASGYHDLLAEWLPTLDAAGRLPAPACLGKSVERGECPEGLALTCTSDFELEDTAMHNAICWCDDPASAQPPAELIPLE